MFYLLDTYNDQVHKHNTLDSAIESLNFALSNGATQEDYKIFKKIDSKDIHKISFDEYGNYQEVDCIKNEYSISSPVYTLEIPFTVCAKVS